MSLKVILEPLLAHPFVSFVVLCAIGVVVPHAWANLMSHFALRHIPTLGIDGFSIQAFKKAKQRYINDGQELSFEGYKKFGTKGIYKLWSTEGFRVVISPDMVGEFKDQPNHVFDFSVLSDIFLAGKYTGLESVDDQARVKLIRVDITQKHMNDLLPEITDEIYYGLPHRLGECEDWTPFNIHDVLLQAVTQISGRLMFGRKINRSPEWLNFAKAYPFDAFLAASRLRRYPQYLHPFVAPFLKKIQSCNSQRVKLRKLLEPVLAERLAIPDGEKKPNDMLQWVLDAATPEKKNAEYVAQEIRLLSFASILTTTVTVGDQIYSLCQHPEYIELLREEVKRVMKEEGGEFTKQSLRKLELMDSFMKETQRYKFPNAFMLTRRVSAPDGFTFSNGVHLPQGTLVNGIPAAAICSDPAIWGNPHEFDGYRFMKLRETDSSPNKHLFTSTSLFSFGSGKHACPGRFLAAAEIKIVLAVFLMNYDVRKLDERKLSYFEGQRELDLAMRVEIRKVQ